MTALPIESMIRRAGLLVVAGLVLQMLTLFSPHPLAFVFFLLVGCPLAGAGILLYLYALVAPHSSANPSPALHPVVPPSAE